jgi:hypothetical protein
MNSELRRVVKLRKREWMLYTVFFFGVFSVGNELNLNRTELNVKRIERYMGESK